MTEEDIQLAEEEKKEKKDSRLRIQETDEAYFFLIDDSTGFGQHQSKIGEGITLFFMNEGRYVTAFQFARPEFSFEDVHKWLTDEGFDPSDQQEAQFEERKEKLVFLENVGVEKSLKFLDNLEMDDDGNEWLRAECLAITPGTWKGFTFSNEVIHSAVKEFEEVNVCEHHSFNEPGDVKGRVLSAEAVDDGVKSSMIVFDQDSIRKIKSEFFHSVSSNFLLTVDEDNTVLEISKVIELTLTHNPACKDAVMLVHEPVKVEDIVQVANEAAKKSDSIVAVFSKDNIPPPIKEDHGGKMSETTNPEQTSAKLEVSQLQAQLDAQAKEFAKVKESLEEEQGKRIELEKKQLDLEAEQATEKWVVTEKKVAPAVREKFQTFYRSLDSEKQKELEAMLEEAPTVLPVGDSGTPLVEDRPVELEQSGSDEIPEQDVMRIAQFARKKKQEGENLRQTRKCRYKERWSVMPVESSKYIHLDIPVVTFQAEEGARTVSEDVEVDAAGSTKRTYDWGSKIAKGNLVKVDATNSRNWTVMNRESTDAANTPLVGIAHDKARFQNFDALAWLEDAANPGVEEQRSVAVKLFGLYIIAVTIESGGVLPTLGQSVAPSATALKQHEWNRDTTQNGSYCLAPGTLGEEDTVVMLLWDGVY
jgi:hypothetical protein